MIRLFEDLVFVRWVNELKDCCQPQGHHVLLLIVLGVHVVHSHGGRLFFIKIWVIATQETDHGLRQSQISDVWNHLSNALFVCASSSFASLLTMSLLIPWSPARSWNSNANCLIDTDGDSTNGWVTSFQSRTNRDPAGNLLAWIELPQVKSGKGGKKSSLAFSFLSFAFPLAHRVEALVKHVGSIVESLLVLILLLNF